MVEGATGTGKSVLTCKTLFDLLFERSSERDVRNSNRTCINAKLLINHIQQKKVYERILKGYGLTDVVYYPSTFVKNHNVLTGKQDHNLHDPVDVVLIDEAHLLWTQNNQDYNSRYDSCILNEIMKRSRVTVIMFDEFQPLRKKQVFPKKYPDNCRKIAGKENHYVLDEQMRINCSDEQLKWINAITGVGPHYSRTDCVINPIPKDKKAKYVIKVCKTPQELFNLVQKHAKAKKSSLDKKSKNKEEILGLSRMIATYDWDYVDGQLPKSEDLYYKVDIGDDFVYPRNYQLLLCAKSDVEAKKYGFLEDCINEIRSRTNNQRLAENNKSWTEQKHTIYEVGSTYTIQGFDLEYAGVILGPSVRYNKKTKKIWFDKERKTGRTGKGGAEMVGYSSTIDADVGDVLMHNELRVLMTRATKGMFIYAVDKDLQDALLEAQGTM